MTGMPAYGDFTYFGLLLYVVIPTILLGSLGRIGKRWILLTTALVLTVQTQRQAAATRVWRSSFVKFGSLWRSAPGKQPSPSRSSSCETPRFLVWPAVALAIIPLVLTKVVSLHAPDGTLAHLGFSYITFRALDVVLSIHDGVIKQLSPRTWLAFLFFFPVISSGRSTGIDGSRRISRERRTRAEFLDDLDFAVSRVFRGFLYKFVLAMLIHVKWIVPLSRLSGPLALGGYMYAYTFYLFFDFAGYSAFAVGFSRLFGIRTPENFNLPFLSRNIRDFWNPWHISLSFWFRDHCLHAVSACRDQGEWFPRKHTANSCGCSDFRTDGNLARNGLALTLVRPLSRRLALRIRLVHPLNKERKFWPDTPVGRIGSILLTFSRSRFGLLLFSGKLTH
jgi:membrane protein involved in D-alanine export